MWVQFDEDAGRSESEDTETNEDSDDMETEQEEDTQDSDQLISWFDDNVFPTDEFSALRKLTRKLGQTCIVPDADI